MRAIAEPNRRAILRLVWDAEMSAGDIASHFDVSRPAISQHLRVLHQAGLIGERRAGTRRLYRVFASKNGGPARRSSVGCGAAAAG